VFTAVKVISLKYYSIMITPYEKLIIKRIKQYLKKEKLKQIDLAKKLKWAPNKLSDILKERHPIGKNTLQDLSNIGISIEIKEKESPLKKLNEDDIEIAELAHVLTKEQKEALKTIIHGLAKEKSEVA
jgi:transcriptional regulator with XRE-family HTH domain